MSQSLVAAERAPAPAAGGSLSAVYATAYVLLALVAAGTGILAGVGPWVPLAAVAALAIASVAASALARLAFWQKLAFIALAGYVVLNYGFANWNILPRIPLPLGYFLGIAAILLGAYGSRTEMNACLKEPAVLWWLALVAFACAHLLADVPTYGLLAVRDASFIIEGLFLWLGYLLARKVRDRRMLFYAIAVVFLLSAAYSLTFPLGDRLSAMSPVSGTFQAVPLLGSYSDTALMLVAGAFYYLLVAPRVARWPRAVITGLAVLQIAWSLVFQDRSMYICTALAMLFFLFRRGERRVAAVLSGSVVVFFLALTVFGVHLEGRIGAVTPDFLASHARSILLDPTAPEEASAQWRLDLLSAVFARWSANPGAQFVGEGFGQPLTDLKREGDVVVRQPHNTNVTVLVRLGTIGFLLWLGMHFAVLRSLLRFLRRSRGQPGTRNVALWFLLFYLMGMVVTTVQPWLEFSHGAIPFYILIGMALSLSRETGWRSPAARFASPAA